MSLLNTVHREKDGKKEPTRYYSKKQEDAIAKKLGGARVKNSGATAWAKGDVNLDKWLLEAKTKMTPSASISIQKEWLEKNNKEALFMGKPYSALAFNFGPDEPNYYIIDEALFETLIAALENEEE
jgi:hypothetical protein